MFAAKLMVNDGKYYFICRSDLQQISAHLHSYFPDFLLFPVSLDYKGLHFSGLHIGGMSANVYSKYNISLHVYISAIML